MNLFDGWIEQENERRNANENLFLTKDVVDCIKDCEEDERFLVSEKALYEMLHHAGNTLFTYERDSYRNDAKALVILLSDYYKPLGFAGLLAELFWVLNQSHTRYEHNSETRKMARKFTGVLQDVSSMMEKEEEE